MLWEKEPNVRLKVVMEQIVPSIVADLSNTTFQIKMLDKHETVAMKLNEKVDEPLTYIPEYFALAREEVWRNHKQVEQIKLFA